MYWIYSSLCFFFLLCKETFPIRKKWSDHQLLERFSVSKQIYFAHWDIKCRHLVVYTITYKNNFVIKGIASNRFAVQVYTLSLRFSIKTLSLIFGNQTNQSINQFNNNIIILTNCLVSVVLNYFKEY